MTFDSRWAFRDCPWCGLQRAHFMTVAPDCVVKQPGGGSGFLRTEREYTFLACPSCLGVVVVEVDSLGDWSQNSRVTPDRASTVEVSGLPDDVAAYYGDAIRVLRAGVPDAAAVQLRRTIEAAAAHYGISEQPLVRSVQRLIADGHVTKTFGSAIDHVRKLGNVGAHHTDERVDEASALRALKFTTALLRNLFEVPEELRRLQEEAAAADVIDVADSAPDSTLSS